MARIADGDCSAARWLGGESLGTVLDGSIEHLDEHEQVVREWMASLTGGMHGSADHPGSDVLESVLGF